MGNICSLLFMDILRRSLRRLDNTATQIRIHALNGFCRCYRCNLKPLFLVLFPHFFSETFVSSILGSTTTLPQLQSVQFAPIIISLVALSVRKKLGVFGTILVCATIPMIFELSPHILQDNLSFNNLVQLN